MLSFTLRNLIRPGQAFNVIKKNIQKSFSHHLFITNVTVSFSLSATGDIIQQFYRMKVREQQRWDKLRTQNMTCTGVAVGILCHHWYQVLDQYLPGRSTKVVFLKLVLDQLLFSPVCIFVFISTLNIVKGLNLLVDKIDSSDSDKLEIINKRFVKFKEDLSVKGLQLYLADWVVWPPAQFINFYFLPSKYRVLYDNTISLLYDVYTSHVMYSRESKKDSDISSQCTKKDSDIISQCRKKDNDISNQCSKKDSDISSQCSKKDSDISSQCSNVTSQKCEINCHFIDGRYLDKR
ncbi:UNVERIFIED_CONTAM: hypothetical protein RMT77_011760 [Armadillidium vulgare]